MDFAKVTIGMTGTCTGRKGTINAGKKLNFTITGDGGSLEGSYREVSIEGDDEGQVIYLDDKILSFKGDYKNFKLNK